jgi:hypothetical protein
MRARTGRRRTESINSASGFRAQQCSQLHQLHERQGTNTCCVLVCMGLYPLCFPHLLCVLRCVTSTRVCACVLVCVCARALACTLAHVCVCVCGCVCGCVWVRTCYACIQMYVYRTHTCTLHYAMVFAVKGIMIEVKRCSGRRHSIPHAPMQRIAHAPMLAMHASCARGARSQHGIGPRHSEGGRRGYTHNS